MTLADLITTSDLTGIVSTTAEAVFPYLLAVAAVVVLVRSGKGLLNMAVRSITSIFR
jgi:hypothetical protein